MTTPKGSNTTGADQVLIKIAGITMAVSLQGCHRIPTFDETMEKFFVTAGEPDVTLSVRLGDIESCCPAERTMIFDSGALWQMFAENDGYCIELTSPKFGERPYKIGHFNHDFTQGEIIFDRNHFTEINPLEPLEHPLGELLITNLLAQGRGVELHGCGLSNAAGEGYLFVGQSGAGKSTMARIWQEQAGADILSDERVILRSDAGKIIMSGTPWHGEARLASPTTVPLSKIFLLKHGEHNQLHSYSTADAVANLFSCSFPTFYSNAGINFTLGLLAEIATVIPCFELAFTPDKRVIELIDS